MRRRIFWILLLLTALIYSAGASTPTSFCKCTCASNSTIIPLNSDPPPKKPEDSLEPRKSKRTCNDCNRQFCRSYSLHICENVKDEDIFTTCFQRDSAKDQAVVFIFIFATLGLLTYAGVRPWLERWAQKARERSNYIPISNERE